MNEAETRAEYIDPALRDAGWGYLAGEIIARCPLVTQLALAESHAGALAAAS